MGRMFLLLLVRIGAVMAVSIQGQAPKPPLLCDPEKYDTDWFLEHALIRDLIEDHALFYTRGMSDEAQARCNGAYISIWDVWPRWLYDQTDPQLKCIHDHGHIQHTYYANMSKAFARMARNSAYLLNAEEDYENPPTDGIWATYELPTLQDWTNVNTLYRFKPGGVFTMEVVKHRIQPRIRAKMQWKTMELLVKRPDAGPGGSGNERYVDDDQTPPPCSWNSKSHPLNRFIDGKI